MRERDSSNAAVATYGSCPRDAGPETRPPLAPRTPGVRSEGVRCEPARQSLPLLRARMAARGSERKPQLATAQQQGSPQRPRPCDTAPPPRAVGVAQRAEFIGPVRQRGERAAGELGVVDPDGECGAHAGARGGSTPAPSDAHNCPVKPTRVEMRAQLTSDGS
jgi:hypothetical protein